MSKMSRGGSAQGPMAPTWGELPPRGVPIRAHVAATGAFGPQGALAPPPDGAPRKMCWQGPFSISPPKGAVQDGFGLLPLGPSLTARRALYGTCTHPIETKNSLSVAVSLANVL